MHNITRVQILQAPQNSVHNEILPGARKDEGVNAANILVFDQPQDFKFPQCIFCKHIPFKNTVILVNGNQQILLLLFLGGVFGSNDDGHSIRN